MDGLELDWWFSTNNAKKIYGLNNILKNFYIVK